MPVYFYRRAEFITFYLSLPCLFALNFMTRSSSRVKLPSTLRGSPPKESGKTAQLNPKKRAKDKAYQFDTVAVCRCSIDLWVLVHFHGYPDDDDEWYPAADIPDPDRRHSHSSEKTCSSINAPMCPTRSRGMMSRGPPIVSEPAQDMESPVMSDADCPGAM